MKNLTRLALGAFAIAVVPSIGIEPSEAAILGFQIIKDTPEIFEVNFFGTNNFMLDSTSGVVGNNWKVELIELRDIPTGSPMGTPPTNAYKLRSRHQIPPHAGELPLQHPDVVFAFGPIPKSGTEMFEHPPYEHIDIRSYDLSNFSFLAGTPATGTCNQACIDGTQRKITVTLVHTPEPSSIVSILGIGLLGVGSVFKRKSLKQ